MLSRSFYYVRWSLLVLTMAFAIFHVQSGWCQSVSSSLTADSTGLGKSFDTDSIKPSDPSRSGFDVRPNADDFTVHNATLKYLVQLAYDLHDFQIRGGPQWTASLHYDIHAKSEFHPANEDSDASDARLRVQLQELLSRRFNLKVHKAVQNQPIYRLIRAKGSLKLALGTQNRGYTVGSGLLKCSLTTMPDLAALLSDATDRRVIDDTHLTGAYSFSLHWLPGLEAGTNETETDLFTSLNEQLGLRLVSDRGPASVLIIDSADKPSAN